MDIIIVSSVVKKVFGLLYAQKDNVRLIEENNKMKEEHKKALDKLMRRIRKLEKLT